MMINMATDCCFSVYFPSHVRRYRMLVAPDILEAYVYGYNLQLESHRRRKICKYYLSRAHTYHFWNHHDMRIYEVKESFSRGRASSSLGLNRKIEMLRGYFCSFGFRS